MKAIILILLFIFAVQKKLILILQRMNLIKEDILINFLVQIVTQGMKKYVGQEKECI